MSYHFYATVASVVKPVKLKGDCERKAWAKKCPFGLNFGTEWIYNIPLNEFMCKWKQFKSYQFDACSTQALYMAHQQTETNIFQNTNKPTNKTPYTLLFLSSTNILNSVIVPQLRFLSHNLLLTRSLFLLIFLFQSQKHARPQNWCQLQVVTKGRLPKEKLHTGMLSKVPSRHKSQLS